mmetsp:Transcript_4798/g.7214  ORF Transcript_4798/g.7214 Transcript_4798/m.7214 type:complete len:458 (+) Transcript_4798:25-1398(+)
MTEIVKGKKTKCRCRYDDVEIEVEVIDDTMTVRQLILGPLAEAYNNARMTSIDAYCLRCIDNNGDIIDGHETCGQVLSRYDKEVDLVAVREVPVCLARTRSVARPVANDGLLIRYTERLLSLLDDSSAEVSEVRALGRQWIEQCNNRESEALASVDARGRSILHVAASRGDSILCRELAQVAKGALVSALDDDLETPLSVAAHQGRALVLKQLLALLPENMKFIVQEKNRHLMTPLQLACCEDGGRSPHVVRLLVEAGADVNAKCWDKTPLMAAAASDDLDLVQTLIIDLSADPFIRNGEGMMAADYCRTQELADFFFKVMDGHFLTNTPAPSRFSSSKNNNSRTASERRATHLWVISDLQNALNVLDLPNELASALRKTQTQNKALDTVRRAWRRHVLKYHPDKHPPEYALWDEQAQTSWHQHFLQVQAAFEFIESSCASSSLNLTQNDHHDNGME